MTFSQHSAATTRPVVLLSMGPTLVRSLFDSDALARLTRRFDVVRIADPEAPLQHDPRNRLAEAWAIVTSWDSAKVDDDTMAAAPALRGIVHSAGSVRAFVSPSAHNRGVLVSSQAHANAVPVAEYVLAHILLSGKGARLAERHYREHRELPEPIALMRDQGNFDRTVGVIGASHVGRRVIDLLRHHDFRVQVFDPYLSSAEAAELGVSIVELDELMRTSHIVTLHAPLLPSTRQMIDGPLLRSMREGATFINTARGALVDQAALIELIRSGRVSAVLDVTEPEALPANSPLWDLDGVVLTPHIAGSFGNELQRLGTGVADELEQLASTGTMAHLVTAGDFSVRA